MSLSIPSIGDIVMSPHEKYSEDGGDTYLYDQLLCDGGVLLEEQHPLLWSVLTFYSYKEEKYLTEYYSEIINNTPEYSLGSPDNLVDGNTETHGGYSYTQGSNYREFQINLKNVVEVYEIIIFRSLTSGGSTYKNLVVKVSSDNSTWVSLISGVDTVIPSTGLYLEYEGDIVSVIVGSVGNDESDGIYLSEVKIGEVFTEDYKNLPNITAPSVYTPYRIIADLTGEDNA